MSLSQTDAGKLLADGLALVYHEARYVRYLVEEQNLPCSGWGRLSSLPLERIAAWRAVQAPREAAAKAQSVREATGCFERQFERSLADLEDIYANGRWPKRVGGKAWHNITAAVAALRDAMQQGDISEIATAAHLLVEMPHNTGAVREKIIKLDAAVGVQTGRWWH